MNEMRNFGAIAATESGAGLTVLKSESLITNRPLKTDVLMGNGKWEMANSMGFSHFPSPISHAGCVFQHAN